MLQHVAMYCMNYWIYKTPTVFIKFRASATEICITEKHWLFVGKVTHVCTCMFKCHTHCLLSTAHTKTLNWYVINKLINEISSRVHVSVIFYSLIKLQLHYIKIIHNLYYFIYYEFLILRPNSFKSQLKTTKTKLH